MFDTEEFGLVVIFHFLFFCVKSSKLVHAKVFSFIEIIQTRLVSNWTKPGGFPPVQPISYQFIDTTDPIG